MVEPCLSDSSNLEDMERRYEMDGKIKQLPNGDQMGLIEANDGRKFSFTLDDVISDPKPQEINLKVTFSQGFKGKHIAQKIKVIMIGSINTEGPVPIKHPLVPNPPEVPPETTAQTQNRAGFINPYNFVQLWGTVPRCEPTSHEYFTNNSGQIVCKLSFKTPFFTPHTENRFKLPKDKELSSLTDDRDIPQWIKNDKKAMSKWLDLLSSGVKSEHEILGLLKDRYKKPIIPGSSLKGTFRSVAEALSNSCLSVIDFQWDMLNSNADDKTRIERTVNYFSQRIIIRPQDLRVGKIIKLASENGGVGEIEERQKWRVFVEQPFGVENHQHVPTVNLNNINDGEKTNMDSNQFCYHQRPGRPRIDIFAATNMGNGITNGELKITAMTKAKKSQRFIYEGNRRIINFTIADELGYNRANEVAINADKEKSGKYIFADEAKHNIGLRSLSHKLRVGDIVYFKEPGANFESMGPVELYRVLYKHSLDEILVKKHKDFITCSNIKELCPACRIFGWVHPHPKDEDVHTARKGFVHFSTATIDNDKETQWVTLKPLGQPHPSCWQFYLKNNDANYSDTNPAYNDDNAVIRGRKLYWHQHNIDANSVKDMRINDNGQPQPPDNQNKTVELLPEGASFNFTVDFENLSDDELGLLLLTLQPNLVSEIPDLFGQDKPLSKNLYHHFGMGKPLGLGSAEVTIDNIKLIDRAKRYQSLDCSGEEDFDRQGKIGAFIRKALADQHRNVLNNDTDKRNFASMAHIKDLFAMLDWEHAPIPVQYPPGAEETNKNTKDYWESFHWFTSDRQRGRKPRHMLRTPQQILSGDKQDFYPPRDLSP